MTRRPFTRMLSADDVRKTADRLGSHFFDDGAMQFFDSKLLDVCYRVHEDTIERDNEFVYIVTSERFEDDPRQYAVRRVHVWREAEEPHVIKDRFDIERVIVFQDTHARQAKAREEARTVARWCATFERTEGIDGVNRYLREVSKRATVVDIEEVRA